MENSKKFVRMVLVVLFVTGILSLTGCGRTGDESEQTDTAVPYGISETGAKSAEIQADTTGAQDDAQGQDGELMEMIDNNDRNAADSQVWTQEMVDEAERKDRAILEEKVKAAGGISEDEAIAIARKAMEADIGEKAKELEVCIYPDVASFGWKLRLCDITDWDEYKDKGDIAYSVQFGNKEEVVEPKDFFNYSCFVNAVDGSICGAYSLSGDLGLDWDIDDFVWYEH